MLILVAAGCGYSKGASAATTTPQMTMSQTSLAFGNVAVGSSSALSLTLTSSGTAALTISSAAMLNGASDGFSVSGASFPLTLNPKQSVTLQVKFTPTSKNSVADSLMIQSNSSTSSNGTSYVGTTGTGVTASGSPTLTESSTYLTFGNVTVGSSATLPVTLTSSGTSAVTISSDSIGGSGYSVSGASFPMTLSPKQTVTLHFKFAPTSAGTMTGTVTLKSNSSTGATTYINMTGTGVAATGGPQLTPSSTSLSFGDVADGSSASLGLTLTSSGSSAVTIGSATISGTGFTVSGATFPVTLSPKQAVTLQVKFAPTAANAATGTLTVSDNSSSNATAKISLSGTGTQAQVSLSWAAPTNSPVTLSGYNVYRATGTSSSYQRLNSSVNSPTSYVDGTVQSGSSYTYYVESISTSGQASSPSSSVSVTIP